LLSAWAVALVAHSAPLVAAELSHEVRAGESASSIAKLYYGGFELTDQLLRYNGRTGAVIRPGEKLRVPFSEIHVVRPGDTWSEIAQRYRERAAGYEVIARMNGLLPEQPLRVGYQILVPVFVSHTLDRGETLTLLAERYYGDADRDDLLRSHNRIDDPRRLSVGQAIEIPLIMLLHQEPVEPAAAAEPVQPERRFAGQLGAVRTAYHDGDYEQALAGLEPLIERVEREGNSVDRTELWALLAFVYVAFDRDEEACQAYGSANSLSPQKPLDPDLVSPKIRGVLAGCEASGRLRAGR
jgi:LysM repeat protein